MSVTINNIKVDFHLAQPTITFLQGCDMDIHDIRNTLRQIEQTEEGRWQEYNPELPGMVKSWGNEVWNQYVTDYMTIRILPPFIMAFEAGATPFQTYNGNLVGTILESPGAIIEINNAVGGLILSSDIDSISDAVKAKAIAAGITIWNSRNPNLNG